MNTKKFAEAMSEIDDKYINEAIAYQKKTPPKKNIWIKWVAMAASLCLALICETQISMADVSHTPSPDMVQISNPIIEVSSVEEMEKYLDFDVPYLDKKAASYSVFVDDGYPTMGQISYVDGSELRVQYGSGDISGIRGGILEEIKTIDGVEVKYYAYAGIDNATVSYAIWEQKSFAFSYVCANNIDADIRALIQQYK